MHSTNQNAEENIARLKADCKKMSIHNRRKERVLRDAMKSLLNRSHLPTFLKKKCS